MQKDAWIVQTKKWNMLYETCRPRLIDSSVCSQTVAYE